MNGPITDLGALESCIGKLPGPRDVKVIDHLDDHAVRWIAASPFLFAAFGDGGGIAVTAGGGAEGFVRADGPGHLELPAAALDHPAIARQGQGFGSLFLVPGIGETLRVNGRVQAADGARIRIAVEECYMHCAKALIRSEFWAAAPRDGQPADPVALANASRFMALASMDHEGRADLSPKGDPAGALLRVRDGTAWYPDRPGNRRVDSFRNILTQPRIAAMALVPGGADVVHIAGTARIAADATACAWFTVAERTPRLVTRIEGLQLRLERSEALVRARLWPAVRKALDLDPAEIFKAHVRLSRTGGLQAALVRASVSVPGLMRKGLDYDYKKNLY